MTTGKNKEQFEGWYRKNYLVINGTFALPIFYTLEFKMQIGVYLAYYDSFNYTIFVEKFIDIYTPFLRNTRLNVRYCDIKIGHKDLNEAYKEAFKKADELINQKN
jgi:radical SAM superfamily enzyme YgiQ (UPF0313 family)